MLNSIHANIFYYCTENYSRTLLYSCTVCKLDEPETTVLTVLLLTPFWFLNEYYGLLYTQEGFMSKQSFSEKNSKFRFPPLSSMTLLRQDMGKCRFFLLDLLRFGLGLLQKMTHCRSQTQCDISLICCLLFLFSIQHHNKSNTQFIKRRDTIH